MPLSPIAIHRIAHRLERNGQHRVGRMFQGLIFFLFSAVIPPEVTFGARVNLMHHGVGIVMHPNVVIGDDVIIYQHVTLGTDTRRDDPRRLVIGARAVIGAGAVVLGPVTIGEDARIGAGAVVTKDISPGAIVVGNPAREIGRVDVHAEGVESLGSESSTIARNE